MGSKHSSTTSTTTTTTTSTTNTTPSTVADNTPSQQQTKTSINKATATVTNKNENKNKNSKFTGYALVEYKCRKKRFNYEKCYHMNHSAFITGHEYEYQSKLSSKSTSKSTSRQDFINKDDNKDANKDANVDNIIRMDCQDLFEAYKECIYQGMLQDRLNRGLPIPKPQSALGDFMSDD